METKYNEIVTRTSVLEEMKGKYTAERVLRTWDEDFVDEDTTEVVSIERNELILNKGVLLDNDNLTKLNFYLQSGDVKDVAITNQKREGLIHNRGAEVWQVSIEQDKKTNIYLYAKGLKSAIDIVTDFVELNYEGGYSIVGMKMVDSASLMLIPTKKDDIKTSDDLKFYTVDVEVQRTEDEEDTYKQTFILKCKDADASKSIILDFITKQNLKNDNEPPFGLTLLSAKTVSCNEVVDFEFSMEHFKNEKNKENV